MKSSHIFFFKICLLLVPITILLFSFELFERYKVKAWPFEEEMAVFDYLTPRDKNLRWRLSAGTDRNRLGLRNREITKKQDQYRILFLGDSLLFDSDTSEGIPYTAQGVPLALLIEHNLNKKISSKTIEIINAGIPGYTTYQELEFLKIYGLNMEPDLVILGFVFNDLYYKYFHRSTKDNLLAIDPSVYLNRFDVNTFPGILFAKSYLAHQIYENFNNKLKRIKNLPDFPFEKRLDFFLAWKSYAWEREKYLIGELKEILAEKKIKLIIIIFPFSDQVNDHYLKLDRDYVFYPQKKIKEICGFYNIQCFDLTEIIYKNGGLKLFKDYLHLGTEGNDIIAHKITNYLEHNLRID